MRKINELLCVLELTDEQINVIDTLNCHCVDLNVTVDIIKIIMLNKIVHFRYDEKLKHFDILIDNFILSHYKISESQMNELHEYILTEYFYIIRVNNDYFISKDIFDI